MTNVPERPWIVHLNMRPGKPPARTKTFATVDKAYGWALSYIVSSKPMSHIAVDLRGVGRMITLTRIAGRKVLVQIVSGDGFNEEGERVHGR